jgi:uncharacterized protein YndB with AHSA1/START domain
MTEERVTIEREVFIAAPPDAVFGFLVDPTLMAQWIGTFHKLDAKPGGVFRIDFNNGHVALGAFTEVRPHRRVAFTWGWESAEGALASMKPGSSLVEIELQRQEGGTLLRLRHSGLPEDFERIHGDEWIRYLNILAARWAASTNSANHIL